MEGTRSAIIKKQTFLVHDYHGYMDFSRINSEACMQGTDYNQKIASTVATDSNRCPTTTRHIKQTVYTKQIYIGR